MSEGPKKTWIEIGTPVTKKVEYIRADIVEEMREALEELVKYVGRDHAGVGLADLHNKGIYALRRLEGK